MEKNITKLEEKAEQYFEEKYIVPFKGTLNKPYEITSAKNNDPRPSEKSIVENLPTVEQFLKNNGKSPVTILGHYVVAENKRVDTKLKKAGVFRCYHDRLDFLIVCPTTGRVTRCDMFRLPLHFVTTNTIHEIKQLIAHYTSTTINIENVKEDDFFDRVFKTLEKHNNLFSVCSNKDIEVAARISENKDSYRDDVAGCGAIVLSPLSKNNNNNTTLLLNGDDNRNISIYDQSFAGRNEKYSRFPIVSYTVLASLLENGESNKVFQNEYHDRKNDNIIFNTIVKHKNDLQIVDSTAESYKPVSKQLKRAYRSAKKKPNFEYSSWMVMQQPPEKGYSLVFDNSDVLVWHKSPTVVIKNVKKKVSYILGQDEGTYYGCVLADNPTSVNDALTSLMPANARKTKKGLLRQGEWFAIPVADVKSIPTQTSPEFLCNIDANISDMDDRGSVCLPKEDENSSDHIFTHGHFVFDKNGNMYVTNFVLKHTDGDHKDLVGVPDVWYTFERNTALASYSAKGVD